MILRESTFKTELQKALDRTGEGPRTEAPPFQDVAADSPEATILQWQFRQPARDPEQIFPREEK